MKEGRQYSRVNFHRKVNIDFHGSNYNEAQIRDLSLTGMFIFGVFQQKVGDYCLLNLVQTGATSDLSIHASAKVVRKDDEGIAIVFCAMSFDSYMFLQMSLLYEAEEPLVIGLELPEHCPFEIVDPRLMPVTTEDGVFHFR